MLNTSYNLCVIFLVKKKYLLTDYNNSFTSGRNESIRTAFDDFDNVEDL